MVEQHARRPTPFGFALQTVAQEVLALCAQLLWDGGLVAHAHFVHDLKVVLILVPWSLRMKGEKGGKGIRCCNSEMAVLMPR